MKAPRSTANLTDYVRKRDFKQTAEPTGARKAASPASTFVVQKHAASHLHYDLRFSIDGVLKSWAVPKGLPLKAGEKRLAIQVEDHPIAYANFEGAIPKGEYGGGTVMVWDRGRVTFGLKSPRAGLEHGHLDFRLAGKKLCGGWMLIRLKHEPTQWLLIKREDDHSALPTGEDRSVKSGRSMAEIAAGGKGAKPTTRSGPLARLKKIRPDIRAKFFAPMLARPTTDLRPSGAWSYEIKFDGYRAVATIDGEGSALWSRNQKRFEKFSGIEDALRRARLQPVVLDGEIVALREDGHSSFQQLQRFEDGREPGALYYYVFDVMVARGKDVRSQPLDKRRQLLSQIFPKASGSIRLSRPLRGSVSAIVAASRRHGLEGVIAKRLSSPYESGKRSGAWLKLRFSREQEFVIGGFTAPTGSRENFGALLLGTFKGKVLQFAGKVGSGFDSKMLKTLHPVLLKLKQAKSPFGSPVLEKRVTWLKSKLVCQVKFSEWTRDGRLRQPVYLGLRSDKAAGTVERET